MEHFNEYTYKGWTIGGWINDSNTLSLFVARMGDGELRASSKHLIEQRIDKQERLYNVTSVGWDDGRFGHSDCHYETLEEIEAYNEGFREGWNSRCNA